MKIHNNTQGYSGEIAIVGMGCRFPGGIVDLPSFWDFMCDRKEAVSKILPSRWNWKSFYDQDNDRINKSFFMNGSFLTQPIDEFEPLFFGMTPKDASHSDPQQRLLLEVAWQAMEEGGIIPGQYAGQKVGVFVGFFTQDWQLLMASPYSNEYDLNANCLATAASSTMLSARLSYVFDFCGPSMVLDTACSSSLTAAHLACQSLKNGESDMALVAGVNVMIIPHSGAMIAKAHFTAEDGRSKSFDAAADGYGRGEGCGVVVLKRLEDALRDGNKIHAVISGIGVNQDGRNEGITVPNSKAQERLIREVANQGKINLGDIAYVEAHGTGTPVGDPLEAQAIFNTIGAHRPEGKPVVVGSVKANIGHLEAAAGIAGLIKACLCLEHKVVPAQANLKELNPNIPFNEWNIYVPKTEMVPLVTEAKDLYAAVNSFGYGGSNANVILRATRNDEKVVDILTPNTNLPSDNYLLVLSTRQQHSLKPMAEQYINLLRKENGSDLEDICYSVGKYRSSFQRRLAVFGKNKEEIAQKLEDYVNDRPNPDIITGQQVIKSVNKPVYVFSGMGPQWWGMGQWLLAHGPAEFLKTAQEIDTYFKEFSGWSILEEMRKEERDSRINETAIAQPAIFVVQVALAEVLKRYGVEPAAIVGHSVGEIAAAYVAGALTLRDAVKVIYYRSHLQQRFAGQGTMLAVGMPPSTAIDLIKGYEKDVAVAAINSPRAFTLSGSKESLDKIAAKLQEKDEFHRFLKVEIPYHNPVMSQIKEEFEAALEDLQPTFPKIPLYSSVTGRLCDDVFFHDANYWYRNLRQTVLFAEAISTMIHDSYTLFAEIGPHPVLSTSVKECAAALNAPIGQVYSLNRKEPEEKALAKILSSLSVAGLALNWNKLISGRRIDLPFYQWVREKHITLSNQVIATLHGVPVHPVLGKHDWSATRGWLGEMNFNFMPWLSDHKIEGTVVLPAAAYVDAALAAHALIAVNAAKELQEPAVIENLQIKKALLIENRFFPFMSWSVDELTNRLMAYGRTENDSYNWEFCGSVFLRRSAPWGKEQFKALDTLKAQINERIDVLFYYQALKEHGLEYGPYFQTIQELYRGDGEALAHLSVVESEKESIQQYYIHPTLLDGAFQLFGLVCATEQIGEMTFVPIGIKRVIYYGQHETTLYAHACNVIRDNDSIEGDIYLYTESGEPVAQVIGLTLKEIVTQKQKENRRARWLYHYEWKEVEVQPFLAEIARVIVITDNEETTAPLINELSMQGVSVYQAVIGNEFRKESETLYYVRANQSEDYRQFFDDVDINKCRAIVYAQGLQKTDGEDIVGLSQVEALLKAVQGIPPFKEEQKDENFRFIILTKNAEKISDQDKLTNLSQSSVRGFARVLILENPELKVKLIDLETSLLETDTRLLASEILIVDSEDDVALRQDKRFVTRLLPYTRQEEIKLVPLEEAGDNIGFRLVAGHLGMLDKLHYEAFVREAPPPGHIAVEVLVASLNFKDLLKVMGIIPKVVIDDTFHKNFLGMEATVRVVAVGEGAEKAGYGVGDRLVASFPGCLTSYKVVDVNDIFAVHMSRDALIREHRRYNFDKKLVESFFENEPPEFEEAIATLPTVYCTAYYTLCLLANLQKGETILIHSAAGGLGIACIEIAKVRGARIFATAGNEEKRNYLRQIGCEHVWNSRTLEFADGVQKVTNGRGVDVIVNSLSGEALHHSLALLAPSGRFIEVGKRDIAEEKWLPMLPFNKNISFFSMDLDRMLLEKPETVRQVMRDLNTLLVEKEIKTPPCTLFPLEKIVDAFRLMASAQHIGKILVDFRNKTGVLVKPVADDSSSIHEDATYLITGAYGGMGLQLAQWLVSQGARHMVFVGRSLKENDESIQATLTQIKNHGVEILEIKADVTDYQALSNALSEVRAKMPPLKGIFHCAAAIDDAIISNLNEERLAQVILPKAMGAWNLHALTKNIPLDHFVLFSSATTLLGNFGQSAYVAANYFLDALAKYRKQEGLPALSIQWGAIEGGQMLQKDSNAAKHFEKTGVKVIPIYEALATIPLLWKTNQACIGVLDIDWSKWFSIYSAGRSFGRYEELISMGEASYEQTEVLRQLSVLPVEERLPFVVTNLIKILSKTLQISEDSLDGNSKLTELGIDSLVGVELQIAISNTLGCEISLLQLMKEENLQDVAKVLLRKLKVPFESTESLTLDSDDNDKMIEHSKETKQDTINKDDMELN